MRSAAPSHHLSGLNELESNLIEANGPQMSKEEMDAWALNEAYSGMPLPKVRAEPTPQHMIPITLM
eukprot:3630492-Ditylum_brightwellii.AAC.1